MIIKKNLELISLYLGLSVSQRHRLACLADEIVVFVAIFRYQEDRAVLLLNDIVECGDLKALLVLVWQVVVHQSEQLGSLVVVSVRRRSLVGLQRTRHLFVVDILLALFQVVQETGKRTVLEDLIEFTTVFSRH